MAVNNWIRLNWRCFEIAWLLPENADFEPIRVDLKQEHMIIEGIVVGVVRRGKVS